MPPPMNRARMEMSKNKYGDINLFPPELKPGMF